MIFNSHYDHMMCRKKSLEREVSSNIVKDCVVTVIWAKKYGNSAPANAEN